MPPKFDSISQGQSHPKAVALVQKKFQQALAVHQNGQFSEAETIYLDILALQPEHFDAIHLLGMLAFQAKNYPKAIGLINQAIAIFPSNPAFYLNLGAVCYEMKQYAAAVEACDKALVLDSNFKDAVNNRALAIKDLQQQKFQQALCLHQNSQFSEAEAIYLDILTFQPEHFDAIHLLGMLAFQAKNYPKAIDLINQAIAIFPSNPAFYSNLGAVCYEMTQYAAAVEACDKALVLDSNFKDAVNNRALAIKDLQQQKFQHALNLYQNGQFLEAEAISLDILTLQPQHVDAIHLLGMLAFQVKNYPKAIDLINQSTAIFPDNPQFYSNLGAVFHEMKLNLVAVENYDKAIMLNPNFVDAYYNRAIALKELNQYDAAIASYKHTILLDPSYVSAHYNLANILNELNFFSEAIHCYDQAIALKVDYAEAYLNRGAALKKLNQFDEAIINFDKAIAIKSDYTDAYTNRGMAQRALTQMDAAIISFGHALAIDPNHVDAYNSRGNTFRDLQQLEAALIDFEQVIALKADYPYILGMLLFTKMQICDWQELEQYKVQLTEHLANNQKVIVPLSMLAVNGSAALQRKVAELFVTDKYPQDFSLGALNKRSKKDKIRLGYFSADFKIHPVSSLMVGVFEHHDRNKFEVYAFSINGTAKDEMRLRIQSACDHFIDVSGQSDEEVALLCRELELDVAIDLGGYTSNCRTRIFAFRVAPIQINYIGYPGTMGADYMDYIIADETLIPNNERQHYSEEIIYLPCYQANDDKRFLSDPGFTRQALGLPEVGFVFCCFNNPYKINPNTFDCWMRILKQVEGSVLWLYANTQSTINNLRKEAILRGVGSERLVFAEAIPIPEYLARYQMADLFLDTLPFNGGTTASDALWAGLPLLTCTGEAFASRMAASLLTAIKVPELITDSQESYEALAIELATHPRKLGEIKAKLMENRLTTIVFDTSFFTGHLERAYRERYEKYHNT